MFTGPCFEVDDVAEAMAFYLDAFGAQILLRECLPDGQVLSAELTVGAHQLTLTQVPWPAAATNPSAPMTIETDDLQGLTIETDDVQGLLKQARSAGAEVESTSADGPRVMIRDPIGQRWLITPT